MTRGQMSIQNHYALHRDEIRAERRAHYALHREECLELGRARRAYISQKVREIELNDDPESLLYIGDFEDVRQ